MPTWPTSGFTPDIRVSPERTSTVPTSYWSFERVDDVKPFGVPLTSTGMIAARKAPEFVESRFGRRRDFNFAI